MKKLLIACLSALTLFGMTACGGSAAPADPDHTFHAVGGWGEWAATDANKMEAVTVADVKALNEEVGKALEAKPVKYVYKLNITIPEADQGWTAKAKVNGEVKEFDGKFTLKAIIAGYDEEEKGYTNDHWIPNPADTDCQHAEPLTANLFFPTYQKEADEDGFSWSDNPVITDGKSSYTVVVAQYTTVSSATAIGYGFAAF